MEGQTWRKGSQRWGTRGGRLGRLAQFQEQLGKAKGKEAFLKDEAERAQKAKGKEAVPNEPAERAQKAARMGEIKGMMMTAKIKGSGKGSNA